VTAENNVWILTSHYFFVGMTKLMQCQYKQLVMFFFLH